MPRTEPLNWRPILLESFLVVLGVVLALAANEWRQAQVDRRHAREALAAIQRELAANRAAVRESAGYHLMLMDSLRAVQGMGGAPGLGLFSRGFVHPASLLATAWQSAGATGALDDIPYDRVLELAWMYESQATYGRQAEQVGGTIYDRLVADGYDGILRRHANLGSVLATFAYRECELLGAYDRALGTPGPPAPPGCRRFRAGR